MRQARVWVVGVIAAMAAGPSCSGPAPVEDAGASDASSPPVDGGARDSGAPDSGAGDSGAGDSGAVTGTLVVAGVGGIVDSADGLFSIYVPPGALTADTTISIQRLASADVPAEVQATEPLGGVYAVEPDGLVFAGEGAIGWFRFPSVPASLIAPAAPGVPESRAAVFGNARPRDGGAVTEDGTPRTVYRADGSLDAYVPLAHLSLHWATRHGRNEHWLGVDFGAEEHEVGVTWRATEVFRSTAVVSGIRADAYARDGHPISASTANGWTAVAGFDPIIRGWIGDPLGLTDAPGAKFTTTPSGGFAPDFDHVVSPGPSWRCDDVGVSVLTADIVLGGAMAPLAYVSIESPASCRQASVIEASILDTVECRREDTRVNCTDAPTLVANVTARPSTTTTQLVVGTPFFVTLSPTGDAPAAGPATITATEGTATMTATRDTGTGAYATLLDPLFDVTTAATWTSTGATPIALDPPPPASFAYGPSLGLDTDVVLGSLPAGLDAVYFTIEVPNMVCQGANFDDVTVSGALAPVDLGGGASGLDAPARAAMDALALHCGTSVSTLTALPFFIEVGASSTATLDVAGTPVRVSTGQAIRIDGAALTASCPSGQTYCTSACVSLSSDPLNCGGCGVVGVEICDGLDNNCNARADDGCPGTFTIAGAGAVTSPVFGTPVAGHGSASLACPTYWVTAGYRGREVGPIWQLAPYCAGVTMRVDRTVVPYRYFIDAAPVMPPGTPWGGSTGGGTGTTFDRPCPANMMVEGVTVQADANLGTLQAQCVQWELQQSAGGVWQLVRGATTMLPLAGSGTGTSYTWIAPTHSSGTPELINGGNIYYTVGTPIEAINFTTVTAIFRLVP